MIYQSNSITINTLILKLLPFLSIWFQFSRDRGPPLDCFVCIVCADIKKIWLEEKENMNFVGENLWWFSYLNNKKKMLQSYSYNNIPKLC